MSTTKYSTAMWTFPSHYNSCAENGSWAYIKVWWGKCIKKSIFSIFTEEDWFAVSSYLDGISKTETLWNVVFHKLSFPSKGIPFNLSTENVCKRVLRKISIYRHGWIFCISIKGVNIFLDFCFYICINSTDWIGLVKRIEELRSIYISSSRKFNYQNTE